MTLVIMAAGMGSRFGGLKQVEPVGPNGEFILDYPDAKTIVDRYIKQGILNKEEIIDEKRNFYTIENIEFYSI